jgi:hypothetical protein
MAYIPIGLRHTEEKKKRKQHNYYKSEFLRASRAHAYAGWGR